jgi:peroxiredoxin
MQRPWRGLLIVGVVALSISSTGQAAPLQALLDALGVKGFPVTVQAPAFTLTDLQGQERRLHDLRGQVIVLHFWATWGGSCQGELAAMDTLYQTLKDQGFVVVAVALDAEGVKTVAPVVTARQLMYPVLVDPDRHVARQYHIPGPPSTCVIDRQGALIGVVLESREWAGEQAQARIAALVATAPQDTTGPLGCPPQQEAHHALGC